MRGIEFSLARSGKPIYIYLFLVIANKLVSHYKQTTILMFGNKRRDGIPYIQSALCPTRRDRCKYYLLLSIHNLVLYIHLRLTTFGRYHTISHGIAIETVIWVPSSITEYSFSCWAQIF